MSHFTVLVIGQDPERQLAPFHEFECTGKVDQYVVNVDLLEEAREMYECRTSDMVKVPAGTVLVEGVEAVSHPEHGTLVSKWANCFWSQEPANPLSQPEFTLPEGCSEIRLPAKEIETFEQFIQGYYERPLLATGQEPDIHGEHKWGWYRLNDANEVCELIRRTNPNKYVWKDDLGQKIATSYGDANLPFLRENPDRRGEFLLDDERRLVHLLQGLHKAKQQVQAHHGTAPEMAHEGDIRNIGERVPDADIETGLLVRDLLDAFGNENRRIFSGSLPFDREGSRATLLELQSFARACERRNIHFAACDNVPTGSIRKEFVSGKKWDWYSLGGRWTGFFQMKPGVSGIQGRPGLMTNKAEAGTADSAFKMDIDFDRMRAEAEAEAATRYDKVRAIIEPHLPFTPWPEVRDKYIGDAPELDGGIQAARDAYHSQPAKQALNQSDDFRWHDVEDYLIDRATYIHRAGIQSSMTFAVLKDGEWFERGKMGWFGMVADEKDEGLWIEEFGKLIESLPDDTLLSVYDCHI